MKYYLDLEKTKALSKLQVSNIQTLTTVEHVIKSNYELPDPSMNENMNLLADCTVDMCFTHTWIVSGFGNELHYDLSSTSTE